MKLEGIHHITAITGDAQANVDFYAGTLGLRMVKKTVNQDAPSVYHLFYADEQGSPGADITFFEFRGAAAGPRRRRDGPPDRLAGRLGGGARLLGRAARRRRAIESERDGDSAALRRPRGPRARARRRHGRRPAADRRPPGGARRARAAGLPRRARLLRRPGAQRRPARDARVRARTATAGRRAATTAAASGSTTSRRPSAGSRAPGTVHHIAWASRDGRAPGLARARDRRRRPPDAGDRPLLVSVDLLPRAERRAVRDRDPRSRASASTRIPSTSARS